jgi:protein-tyrosine phosphatase
VASGVSQADEHAPSIKHKSRGTVQMISNVLTICHANLCRSPMAAALLQYRMNGMQVRSAGVAAEEGRPPVAEAVTVLAELDIDIGSHRSMLVTRQLASEADLILVMNAEQQHHLEALYPFTRGKVFLIRNFDGADIEDPVGMTLDDFRFCRQALVTGIDDWVQRLGNVSQQFDFREWPSIRHQGRTRDSKDSIFGGQL